MPYVPDSAAERIVFTGKNWIQADSIAKFVEMARGQDVNIRAVRSAVMTRLTSLRRRFELHRHVPEGEWVELTAGPWPDICSRVESILMVRGTNRQSNIQGGSNDDAFGNDSIRAWTTLLNTIYRAIIEGEGVITRADIDLRFHWTPPPEGPGPRTYVAPSVAASSGRPPVGTDTVVLPDGRVFSYADLSAAIDSRAAAAPGYPYQGSSFAMPAASPQTPAQQYPLAAAPQSSEALAPAPEQQQQQAASQQQQTAGSSGGPGLFSTVRNYFGGGLGGIAQQVEAGQRQRAATDQPAAGDTVVQPRPVLPNPVTTNTIRPAMYQYNDGSYGFVAPSPGGEAQAGTQTFQAPVTGLPVFPRRASVSAVGGPDNAVHAAIAGPAGAVPAVPGGQSATAPVTPRRSAASDGVTPVGGRERSASFGSAASPPGAQGPSGLAE